MLSDHTLTLPGVGLPAADVRAGDVVDGKYRLERVLATGGMGIVLLATHLPLERPVALKVMHSCLACDPDARRSFSREARVAATLRSDHVARVLDAGSLDAGAPYLVMEHLEGRDLAAVLRERGRLEVGEAVGYLLQACDALEEAHAAGIVHRDLKPGNVFVVTAGDRPPLVKVLDFGVSQLAGDETRAGLCGSPLYMSPEQILGDEVDARTDIWSMGALLYELLTGLPPFPGDSLARIRARVVEEPALPLGPRRPDVPPELERIVERCLAKDRDARFPTVTELARALAPFALGACEPELDDEAAGWEARLGARHRGRERAALGAAVLGAAGLVFGYGSVLSDRMTPAPSRALVAARLALLAPHVVPAPPAPSSSAAPPARPAPRGHRAPPPARFDDLGEPIFRGREATKLRSGR